MSEAPRLLPSEPMPPYSYVPGKFPHPIRDRAGHSFGEEAEVVLNLDPEQWQECRAYLRGIDLFNHGYYWEAHESWEAVWHAAGRRGDVADFIKGLIKLAAASVKAREGRTAGVQRHAIRSDELFAGVQATRSDDASMMGLSLAELRRIAQKLAGRPGQAGDTRDQPVVRIHGFLLEPK